jgi:hypothetical protein
MVRYNVFPSPARSELPDTDLIYRKASVLFYRVADVGMNTMNTVSSALFIDWFTSAVNDFARNAPAHIVYLCASPFKSTLETGEAGVKNLKETIDKAFASGSVPIGITAALSTLFIVILFCFI